VACRRPSAGPRCLTACACPCVAAAYRVNDEARYPTSPRASIPREVTGVQDRQRVTYLAGHRIRAADGAGRQAALLLHDALQLAREFLDERFEVAAENGPRGSAGPAVPSHPKAGQETAVQRDL
jgi:hypothetical protein